MTPSSRPTLSPFVLRSVMRARHVEGLAIVLDQAGETELFARVDVGPWLRRRDLHALAREVEDASVSAGCVLLVGVTDGAVEALRVHPRGMPDDARATDATKTRGRKATRRR